VKGSRMPWVQVQTVAAGLDIHPFMRSRWRTEARDGVLTGRAGRGVGEGRRAREIKRLQALEREHAILKEELFCSARRRRSLPSVTASAPASRRDECARATGSPAPATPQGAAAARAPGGSRTGTC